MAVSARPPPALELTVDLVLEEASRAMARAGEQFRSFDEHQMKRLLGAGAGAGGKLRVLAAHLDQIHDLLWGAHLADGQEISPSAARLQRVKDAIHDLEDLLDDMEYHILKFQAETHSKVSSRSPLVSVLKFRKRLVSSSSSSSDEASRSRLLKDLDSVAISLGALLKEFQGAVHAPNPPLAVPDFDAAATPSHGHKVFGRDKELNDIVQMLVEPRSFHCHQPILQVLPIVGMGGLGKTTLARSVYDDDRVKRCFDLSVWVHVSHTFCKMEVTKEILCSVNPRYRGSMDKEATFEMLQVRLKQFVASKRFLLVLDDVWEYSFTHRAFQEILSPLRSAESGSRVIVITRTEKLANTLGTFPSYFLDALGTDDCWSLLKESAFGGGNTHDSVDELEQIGRKIAAKLKGLPLAAKVVGGLLGARKSTRYWRSMLETDFYGDITLSSLQLSYSCLPGRLKQCFAFCSIFPKNWKFDQTYLIHLWMANGFIQPQPGAVKRMEDLGTDYFNVLVSRGFFQTPRQDPNTHYMMHDLIHDLAVSASTYDCCRIELGMTSHIPSTVRHLSATADSLPQLSRLHIPPKLHTLLVLGTHSFSLNCLQDDILKKLKSLRVLDLRDSDLTELPQAVCHLSHLRFLSLSRTIQRLPELISKLLHLQTLRLMDKCSLDKLPAGISMLVKLRHIDIDTKYFAQVAGIGRLVNLQGSVEFCAKKGGGQTLEELKGINGLHGQLKIKGLDNVSSKEEACKAELSKKHNLRVLKLEWTSACRDLVTGTDAEILENLQPHSGIKELYIRRYLGSTAPSWLQLTMLKELQCLHLTNCRSLNILPPLGLLPSLKDLHMKELCTIDRIGHEFYGKGDVPFPSLKVLEIDDFPSLLEWSGEARGNPFPRLQRLKIVDCPKLIEVPSIPPSVSELTIERTWLISYMRLAPFSSRSEMLTLDICTASVFFSGFFHQRHLECIAILNIKAANNQLVAAEGLLSFTSLQRLQLCHSELTDQNLGCLLQVLPSLCSLEMMDLPNIISLLVPAKISLCATVTELQISNCPLLSSLASLDTFNALKRLVIEKCPKLTATSFPANFWRLTSLKVLSISYCTELQSLPAGGLPTSLEALHLVGCHPKLNEKSSNDKGNSWEVFTPHKTLFH